MHVHTFQWSTTAHTDGYYPAAKMGGRYLKKEIAKSKTTQRNCLGLFKGMVKINDY